MICDNSGSVGGVDTVNLSTTFDKLYDGSTMKETVSGFEANDFFTTNDK